MGWRWSAVDIRGATGKWSQGSGRRKVGTWLLGGYFGFLTNSQRTPKKQTSCTPHSSKRKTINLPRSAETTLHALPRPDGSRNPPGAPRSFNAGQDGQSCGLVTGQRRRGLPKPRKRPVRNPTPRLGLGSPRSDSRAPLVCERRAPPLAIPCKERAACGLPARNASNPEQALQNRW